MNALVLVLDFRQVFMILWIMVFTQVIDSKYNSAVTSFCFSLSVYVVHSVT